MYKICVHENTRHMFPWRYDCNTHYKEKPKLAISTYRKYQDPEVDPPGYDMIDVSTTSTCIIAVWTWPTSLYPYKARSKMRDACSKIRRTKASITGPYNAQCSLISAWSITSWLGIPLSYIFSPVIMAINSRSIGRPISLVFCIRTCYRTY